MRKMKGHSGLRYPLCADTGMVVRPHPDIEQLTENLHRNKGEFVGNYVKLTKKDSIEIYRIALHA